MAEENLDSMINELAAAGDPDATAHQAAETAETTPTQADAPAVKEDRAPKMVPIQALDAVRGELKERDAKIDRMENRFQDFLQRLATYQAQPQQPPPEPPQLPSRDEDPISHFDARMQQLESLAGQYQQSQAWQAQQQEVLRHQQAVGAAIAQHEAAFAAKMPDYPAALNHLRALRSQELELAGITDPGIRTQIIGSEEQMLARANLQAGRNPAEVIYGLARHRGYQGAASAAPQSPGPGAQKLADIAKGMEASKSLSSVPGGTDETEVKLAQLAELEGAAFDKAFDALIRGAGGSGTRDLFH